MVSVVPKTLWKLTIKPYGNLDPNADAFEFCRQRGLVGVGWRFEQAPAEPTEVKPAFRMSYPGKRYPRALGIMTKRAVEGDHFWVYGDDSYHICRVDGEWRYEDGHEWDDNDIHNIRPATWREVPQELVPGIVRRHMTMMGSAMQITNLPEWCRYSQQVFERGEDALIDLRRIPMEVLTKQLTVREPAELFSVLDQDETEDLVGLYLQEQGWKMLKSSAYRSQRDIECLMRRRTSSGAETCGFQVKSGDKITIDPSKYAHLIGAANFDRVFVFSTASPPYSGTCNGVTELNQEDIADFLIGNLVLMPEATQLKLALWTEVPL